MRLTVKLDSIQGEVDRRIKLELQQTHDIAMGREVRHHPDDSEGAVMIGNEMRRGRETLEALRISTSSSVKYLDQRTKDRARRRAWAQDSRTSRGVKSPGMGHWVHRWRTSEDSWGMYLKLHTSGGRKFCRTCISCVSGGRGVRGSAFSVAWPAEEIPTKFPQGLRSTDSSLGFRVAASTLRFSRSDPGMLLFHVPLLGLTGIPFRNHISKGSNLVLAVFNEVPSIIL